LEKFSKRGVWASRPSKSQFRDPPTLDVLTLPEKRQRRNAPTWLDDPTQRFATIFYTGGTTGMLPRIKISRIRFAHLGRRNYFSRRPVC
jgi:hypothetical protein